MEKYHKILEELLKNKSETTITINTDTLEIESKNFAGKMKGHNTGFDLVPTVQIIPIFGPVFISCDECVDVFMFWCELLDFPNIPAIYTDIVKAFKTASSKAGNIEVLISVYSKKGNEYKNTFRCFKNGQQTVQLFKSDIDKENKIRIIGIDRFNTKGKYKSEFVFIGEKI